MFANKVLIMMLIAFKFATSIESFKYDIVIRETNIFLPCPEYPNNYLDSFMRLPKNVTLLPDDTVEIVGDFLVTYEFSPEKHYGFTLDFKKSERGSWVDTIYSIKRQDFCESLFDQNEVWGPYVKNIAIEQRKCPFKKDQIVSVNFKSEQGFFLPSPTMEGYYWGRFMIRESGEGGQFCCMDHFFHLYRS